MSLGVKRGLYLRFTFCKNNDHANAAIKDADHFCIDNAAFHLQPTE